MQRTSVNATVDITCTSSKCNSNVCMAHVSEHNSIVLPAGGVYNQSDAKLYCMALKQPNIYTNAMENSTDRERR